MRVKGENEDARRKWGWEEKMRIRGENEDEIENEDARRK